MRVLVKRCYIICRRKQIVIFIALILSIAYYLSLNDSLKGVHDLVITNYSLKGVPDLETARRNSVIEYIENRLAEALNLDKGTGCDVPHLDPFAKEIMKFHEKRPKVVCKDNDWVQCYQSRCNVLQNILDTTSDIECEYRDIIYITDNKFKIAPPVKVEGSGVYTLNRSDHVKIKCTGKREKSLVKTEWSGYSVGFRTSVERVAPPPGRENTLNVLMFAFDSTSKNGFIRKMPKSYKCLTEELEGTVLDGYNIVGDGTKAALFPILTGRNELELPDVWKILKNRGTVDDHIPLIFYKLKQDGYRTAYFEDTPGGGTFNLGYRGFVRQPADHYLRAFCRAETDFGKKWWTDSRYCMGGTPQYKLLMNLTDQFLNLDGKRFCLTFIADISHDDFNMISTADEDFVDFLRSFKAQGRLKDTLLIVMGDHGIRAKCEPRTLHGVSWVMRQHARSRKLPSDGGKDADGYVGKSDAAVDIPTETYQLGDRLSLVWE